MLDARARSPHRSERIPFIRVSSCSDHLPADVGPEHLDVRESCGVDPERVLREDREVRERAGSQGALLLALDYAREPWVGERTEATRGLTGVERLVELARWMCQTKEHDNALRSLWIEVVAGSGPEIKVVTDITDRTFTEFQQSARQAELRNAEEIADILYLYARGFHVKNVEDPDNWNDERINRALTVLLESLIAQNR